MLSVEQWQTVITSLGYSRERIRDTPDSAYSRDHDEARRFRDQSLAPIQSAIDAARLEKKIAKEMSR